jgi:glycosyltransferase involved in cell wall biosynthesis
VRGSGGVGKTRCRLIDMLAIVTTHPIQYQTPIWQALGDDGRVPFEVWYLTRHGIEPTRDADFGATFSWDIDTLSGYPYRFLDVEAGASPIAPFHCRLHERLRDRIRAAGVEAVWIQGWQVAAYWQAVREARAAGAEIWLRGESNDLAKTSLPRRAVRRALLHWLFANVDRFLCIGSANRRLYRRFGVPEQRLLEAPYAVDNVRFARQAADLAGRRSELRESWGIAEDACCILFCGKLIAKKRPLDLVRAAQLVQAQPGARPIHLLFAGSGLLKPQLAAGCTVCFDSENGGMQPAGDSDKPRASFAGFLNQTEISRAYVAADCLVLPSDHGETWGLVVNEALASGLPCVVSDACGCAEDLVDPTHSYPVGDVTALAARIVVCGAGGFHLPSRKLPTIADSVGTVVAAYRDATGTAR